MPVSSPPVVAPLTGTPPNRGQSEEDFNTNQQNFVDYQVDFVPDVNDLADWFEDTANFTETQANAAESSATAAATSEFNADASADRAEAAQAAAEAAAGLTPDPNFGMVIVTTAATDVKTSTYTAVLGKMQDVDTSGGAFAITPPASPSVGQWFGVRDYNQSAFNGIFPWIDYTSDKIIGLAEDCYIDVNTIIFEWRGATKGWCV